MNTRKIANLISFVCVGLVAGLMLAKFLCQKVFSAGDSVVSAINTASFYLVLVSSSLCAFSFAKSRRNYLYMLLFLLFVVAIVVFNFIL